VAAQLARELGVPGIPDDNPITDPKHLAWIRAAAADLKNHAGRSMVLAGSRQSAALHQLALAINLTLGNIGPEKPLLALQTGNTGRGNLAALKADIEAGHIDTLFLLTPGNPVYDAPTDLDFPAALAKVKTSFHLGERTHATAHAATWHIPAAHYLESWSDARSARGTYTVVQPMILPLYPECVSELELLAALLTADGNLTPDTAAGDTPSPAYLAVRKTFATLGGEGQAPWKKLLREGFLAGSSYQPVSPSVAALPLEPSPTAPSENSLEVIFTTDSSVFDGRWIDNAWLQEAPDPVSKLTWDNAALIAPKTAKALGIYDQLVEPEPVSKVLGVESKYADVGPDGEGENRSQPMIAVTVNGITLEIPVLISFGQAENTLVIPLGYGQGFDEEDDLGRKPANQSHVGLVGINRGFNAYPLRTSATTYLATGATVKPVAKRYPVALTQEHHAMYGRALAREVSTIDAQDGKGGFKQQLANVRKQGNDSHAPPNVYLYKPEGSATWNPGKDGKAQPLINDPLHQWAMSIDLSSCMGCNACLVACQAENNIPIVGKQQVAKGREMHWIRMDRYFATQKNNSFDADNPALVPQPVACVHCESAPCETVCPVNATVHTEDGLNAMAYNRCIGTRYCANNCPYKARRFNFFDYNKRNPLIAHNLNRGPLGKTTIGDAEHLQKNPNVTIRMRGVMEKCTYCVQRLKDAVIRQKRGQKQEALTAGKPSTEMQVTPTTLRIPADSVKVACQEACPAGAITFGNLVDKENSAVGRSKRIDRNYDLLNYIGTRPRTSYLARVKNPNPDMPDAAFVGKATIHMV
jgi:molybdopterin-containing oxidoreductase family iron-sulfur binding subunit